MKTIKVGSDFSGVGAFNQSLNRLNIKYDELFACDMDKYARETFIYNYGEPKYYPFDVYEREIPSESLDIYMTSPPCQTFSIAGQRLGKNDNRGILFFNSHEFIKINKPRYFIFENVKGLLSDNNGTTFKEWINYLGGKSVNGLPVLFPHEDATPYHIYYKVLNAKDYGVPQKRERIFIVGIRDDIDNNFTFPIEQPLLKTYKSCLEKNVETKYFLSEKTLNNLVIKSIKQKEKGNGFIFTPIKPFEETGHIAKTITTKEGSRIVNNFIYDNGKIRRLTPRECFRLMDFPETFNWPVSDSQAYKQAGNSIVVNVLCEIIKKFNL
jgi:DNA (cytosine-5)-methyltransferase 1